MHKNTNPFLTSISHLISRSESFKHKMFTVLFSTHINDLMQDLYLLINDY